ncbi:hypothetical protein KMT30_05895 [Streptomyces sp. IBSBF 2953]|nr:hypothetical protein [Streptomyces hayashii]
MADTPFLNPAAEPQPFDVKAATGVITAAALGYLQIMFRAPGTAPDKDQAATVMGNVKDALLAGIQACSEVTRIRTELGALRDGHRPQPHADPTKPGALCAACSIHGSLVAWPCATWSAAERILTHGKA